MTRFGAARAEGQRTRPRQEQFPEVFHKGM